MLEIIAAITGSYYILKKPYAHKVFKYLVYFLWFTVITETIAMYTTIAYFTKYEYFGFTKDTGFEQNYWLFNIYLLVDYSFFLYFFTSLLKKNKIKKTLNIINIVYVIIGTLILIASDTFFIRDSIYTVTLGTILLLFAIILFYFDLLKSDKIINFKKYLPFYISIGLLGFNMCTTPLSIFSIYFERINELFVNVKINIYLFANIFMYFTFILGFIICTKKKAT